MSRGGPEKPQTSGSCISFVLHFTFILNHPGGAFCAGPAGVADTVTSGLESGHKIGAPHPRHELPSPPENWGFIYMGGSISFPTLCSGRRMTQDPGNAPLPPTIQNILQSNEAKSPWCCTEGQQHRMQTACLRVQVQNQVSLGQLFSG